MASNSIPSCDKFGLSLEENEYMRTYKLRLADSGHSFVTGECCISEEKTKATLKCKFGCGGCCCAIMGTKDIEIAISGDETFILGAYFNQNDESTVLVYVVYKYDDFLSIDRVTDGSTVELVVS